MWYGQLSIFRSENNWEAQCWLHWAAFLSIAVSTAALKIHALHSKGPCFFINYELAYTPLAFVEHISNTESRQCRDENQNLIYQSILFRLTLLQLYYSTLHKTKAIFFSLVRIMYFYGWVLHECMLLTQGTKKKSFPVSLSVYNDMCQKEVCLDIIRQLAEKLS